MIPLKALTHPPGTEERGRPAGVASLNWIRANTRCARWSCAGARPQRSFPRFGIGRSLRPVRVGGKRRQGTRRLERSRADGAGKMSRHGHLLLHDCSAAAGPRWHLSTLAPAFFPGPLSSLALSEQLRRSALLLAASAANAAAPPGPPAAQSPSLWPRWACWHGCGGSSASRRAARALEQADRRGGVCSAGRTPIPSRRVAVMPCPPLGWAGEK